RIENKCSLKTNMIFDHVGQFGNGDIASRADIDVGISYFLLSLFIGVLKVPVLHDEHTGIRHILRPQEFPSGPATSPYFNGYLSSRITGNPIFFKHGLLGFSWGRSRNFFDGQSVQITVNAIPIP